VSAPEVAVYTCACAQTRDDAHCAWEGPADEMKLIEWVPDYLRGTHAAARNSGCWPHNGALLLAVHHECAKAIIDGEGDPETWPDGCEWVCDLGFGHPALLDHAERVEEKEVPA
jgi:hypothetical protein